MINGGLCSSLFPDNYSPSLPLRAIWQISASVAWLQGVPRGARPPGQPRVDEAEKLGHHTPELDAKFTDAGFYRMLQPRRFGGYAFGMDTFWKVIFAVAEGDPGTAWG